MRLVSLLLSLTVLVADLLTKCWVQSNNWLWYYPVIEGFFTISYVRNEGIAFGLFHELQSEWKVTILSFMAVVAVMVVLYYIWQTPLHRSGVFVSLGLLLGGIMANCIDRLLNRHVTDFLELHWKDYFSWPTFNLADAAITCGVFFMFYETFWAGRTLEAQDE